MIDEHALHFGLYSFAWLSRQPFLVNLVVLKNNEQLPLTMRQQAHWHDHL